MKSPIIVPVVLGVLFAVAETISSASPIDNQEKKIREYVNALSSKSPRHPNDAILLLDYIKSEGITTNEMLRVMREIVKEASIFLEDEAQFLSFETNRMFSIATDTFYATNDKTIMPFLESKLHSTNRSLRHRAAITYLRLLEFNDPAKYKTMVSDGSLAEWEKRNFFSIWLSLIRRQKKETARANLEKVYETLLILAETEDIAPDALDDMLCEVVEGYAVSIQRQRNLLRAENNITKRNAVSGQTEMKKAYVPRLLQTGDAHRMTPNGGTRTIKERREAVEKIPEEERIDLRPRFKVLSSGSANGMGVEE